uniref:Uncharacterized protein n=1 Tax=Lutzomyia longipalpis TaxID=7200 RepID=A0A1B0CKQ6_LUTLO
METTMRSRGRSSGMRGSTTNLSTKDWHGSGNSLARHPREGLMRSSTTNLATRCREEGSLGRERTHRHSNGNLNDEGASGAKRSRKNSSASVAKVPISRTASNSNLKIPSLRRGSIGNIPRASLNASYTRQNSLQAPRAAPSGGGSGRPHTSGCEDVTPFEWPSALSTSAKQAREEPLPSDLEVLSTKLLGKKSNLKLKTVTIIHSATTETVRLPEDNNGVIVHTAVRTKVPLKKKVRGERSKKSKLTNQVGDGQPSTSQKTKPGKRVLKASRESPKKLSKGKKKTRVSAPVVAEEQQQKPLVTEPTLSLKSTKRLKKDKKKHKEIIDYSNRTENHSNTFSKVHKWLLESPVAAQPVNQVEHSGKMANLMSKSQSTPERLTQRSPMKTKSVGNLNDKVKLQVVYKPPFKFSLKLSKNASVKTHVIANRVSRNARKIVGRADKKRVGVLNVDPETSRRRTALLIRTTEDAAKEEDTVAKTSAITPTEPNYETVEGGEVPVYENVNAGINTATFRVSRSSSGGHMTNSLNRTSSHKSQSIGGSSGSNTMETTMRSRGRSSGMRGSTTNLSTKDWHGSGNSLARHPREGLMRSSTTNLATRCREEGSLGRERTHRHSNGNLNDEGASGAKRSRKNSSASVAKVPISRTASNSNLKIPSLRRGSIGNIPRASLNASYTRQNSLQAPRVAPSGGGSGRPHTSGCEDVTPFEWPSALSTSAKQAREEPLPSDLEVMCSDVENLVHDR